MNVVVRRRAAVRVLGVSAATAALVATTVVGGGATHALATNGTSLAAASKPAPTPTPSSTPKPADKKDKVVYLTFDDGPHKLYTPQILWLLDKYEAKATFFMVGKAAKANPDVVRQVRDEGHAIGNHTFSHPWLTKLTDAQVRKQMRDTDAVIGRTSCMRPPGGHLNDAVREVVADERKAVAMWHIDTGDWKRPGAKKIAEAALSEVTSGSVILMHDGGGDRSETVSAAAKVLRDLRAEGYAFETLPKCRL